MLARRCLAVPVLLALFVAGVARGAGAPPWPNSIVVLGHSGATGESSDPKRPHVEVRANSWATGTNPAVDSVYLRILARNPRIKGHAVNLAQGGATVVQLQSQAQHVALETPPPDLILIQIMDNDMVCPAAASDYRAFHAGLSDRSRRSFGAPASIDLRRQPVRQPPHLRTRLDARAASYHDR